MFHSQFYQQTDSVEMGGPASLTTSEIYMQAHEQNLRHYNLQKLGDDLLMRFIPFLKVHPWETFFHDLFIKTLT